MTEEHLGYWWIPENPERRIAGVLSFDRDHRASLELMETFEIPLDSRMRVGMHYPLILGQDRSGKNFALMDCWKEGGHTNLLSGRSWSTVRSQKVLMGLPDDFDASLSFDSLELRSPSFSQWWRSEASQLTTRSSRKHWSVALKVRSLPPVHLCSWKGISVDFVSSPVSSASLRRTKQADVDEDICLRLTSPHDRSLEDFLMSCNKICTFMAVMLQGPATMPHITAYSNAHMTAVDGSSHFLFPVVVVSPIAGCTNSASSDKQRECLLPVQVSLPLLRKMLRHWSTHYSELEAVRGVLLGTERVQHSCSDNRLTMAVAALEGLDRISNTNEIWSLRDWKERVRNVINPAAPAEVQEWAHRYLAHSNEPNLRHRLQRQFKDCAGVLPMTSSQRNSCINICVAVRVRTAHSLAAVPLDRKSGIRIIQATVQIEAVLLVSLFKYLGCTDDDLQAAAARDLLTWQSIQNVFGSLWQ
ncbi:MAG: ApeA N-terminal domain 1-containing protein [Candidatus Cryosericum sp.]